MKWATVRAGAVLVGIASLLGCSSLPVSARAASDEVAVAETLRHDAPLAAAQCQTQATYAWYEVRLGLGPDGPLAKDEVFPTWYDHALADSTLTWKAYCDEVDKTGAIFHGGVLTLRGYARAVLALAAGQDFDGTGLTKATAGFATMSAILGAPSAIGDAAKTIGSVATSLVTIIEKHVRAQVLRLLVSDAAPLVIQLSTGLTAYLDALEAQRALVEHHRSTVLRASDRTRDANGKLGTAADGFIAFDRASKGDATLSRTKRILARDRALLAAMSAAHAELAKMPWTERAPPALLTKLDELEAALGAIETAAPEGD